MLKNKQTVNVLRVFFIIQTSVNTKVIIWDTKNIPACMLINYSCYNQLFLPLTKARLQNSA